MRRTCPPLRTVAEFLPFVSSTRFSRCNISNRVSPRPDDLFAFLKSARGEFSAPQLLLYLKYAGEEDNVHVQQIWLRVCVTHNSLLQTRDHSTVQGKVSYRLRSCFSPRPARSTLSIHFSNSASESWSIRCMPLTPVPADFLRLVWVVSACQLYKVYELIRTNNLIDR